MSFLAILIVSKASVFFNVIKVSQRPSYHASQSPLVSINLYIYIYIYIELTFNAHNVPYVFLCIFQNCIQCFQLSMSWCPLLFKKKRKVKSNLVPLVFLHPFEHLTTTFCHFVILCQHSHLFCSSSSFVIIGVV